MSRIHPGTAAAHVREHNSLLARSEKRLLVWIAERLPSSVGSDHLSLLGLTAMAAAGASFALFPVNPSLAAVGVVGSLTANWFGDSLDGTVARVRRQQRPRYGFYVDHVIDVAGSAMLFAGMACSGLMSPIVALAVLAAYLLVSSESYLATHAAGVFKMSFLGFGPTELRILLMIGAIKAATASSVTVAGIGAVRLFELGGVIGAAGLLVVFVVSAVRNTRSLYAAEPLPAAVNSRAA